MLTVFPRFLLKLYVSTLESFFLRLTLKVSFQLFASSKSTIFPKFLLQRFVVEVQVFFSDSLLSRFVFEVHVFSCKISISADFPQKILLACTSENSMSSSLPFKIPEIPDSEV